MKRSFEVAAPLLAATALTVMAGCRRPEMQRCVDENNRVVDDSLCGPDAQRRYSSAYHGGGFPIYPYHYYYGGLGGYAAGTVVSGGTTTPVAGHSYATSTVRGGFGSSRGGNSEGSQGGGGE